MVALVFVHGTGVRQPAYVKQLQGLRNSLGLAVPGVEVHPCFWGGAHGGPAEAGPTQGEAAVSTALSRNGLEDPAVGAEDRAAVQWGLLYEDPLALLRQLGQEGNRKDGGLRRGDRSGPSVERRARVLASEPPAELAEMLGEADLLERYRLTVEQVLRTTAFREAVHQALPDGKLATALASAIVAQLLMEVQRAGEPIPWDTTRRDEAVSRIAEALGGETRGLGLMLLAAHGWAAHRFGVMRAVEKRRDTLMDGMEPQVGDILRYLARGAGVRAFIADRIADVFRQHGPVVLLAHSLGGIAAVDLLARENVPGVRHLVTFGSQAGHLYRLGALPSLDTGEPLPPHFPRWTNLYDRRDLLGFPAEPQFQDRVRDIEVTSGQPFPVAHSAYFPNPAVHKLLAEIITDPA